MNRPAHLAAGLAVCLSAAAAGDELFDAGKAAYDPAVPFARASFLADGKQVAVLVGSEIRVWNFSKKTSTSLQLDGGAGRGALAVSDDGRWTASSATGEIKIWNARSRGRLQQMLKAHEAGFRAMQFLPGSQLLASWGQIEKFRQPVGLSLWDVESGASRGSIYEPGKSQIHAFAFAPDGKAAATLGELEDDEQPRVALWETESVKRVADLPCPLSQVPRGARLAFSPGGDFLVLNYTFTADRSGIVQPRCLVWNVARRSVIFPPGRGQSSVAAGALAFSPTEQLFAGGSGNDALLGTVDPLRLRHQLQGHEAPVTWTEFSPDGRLLATASADWTVVLWDVESGEKLTVLRGHRKAVRAVQFAPDGNYLLSLGDDSVKVWDIEDVAQRLARRSPRQ